MKVYFIRHGKTLGNLEKRFIGRIDQPLEELGKVELREKISPKVDRIIVSPMKRCIETCEILYPASDYKINEKLKEINFGTFENMGENELKREKKFIDWITYHGDITFDEGENLQEFQMRCMEGFISSYEEAKQEGLSSIAFVIHGGTIMALLGGLSNPEKNYHHWVAENGCGYSGEIVEKDGFLRIYNLEVEEYSRQK